MPLNKNTGIGPTGGLCSYTYTGPPLTIGDPVCPFCGRYLTKTIFVCDCDKEIVKTQEEETTRNQKIDSAIEIFEVALGMLHDLGFDLETVKEALESRWYKRWKDEIN
jgi:hypothetical protein